jgi:hypothetical protein
MTDSVGSVIDVIITVEWRDVLSTEGKSAHFRRWQMGLSSRNLGHA